MYWLAAFLTLLAAPFWESKAPPNWTDPELQQMFTDSPWAQMLTSAGPVNEPPVQIYLATAAPMQQAERERDARNQRRRPPGAPAVENPLAEEYRAWFEENHVTQIVLAVRIHNNSAFFDEKETRRMEEESVMRVGRKKLKMTGHFPPDAKDPYLRMAFPRSVDSSARSVSFDLYLPGVPMPFREVEFKLKDLLVNGKLEM
jgi:hypothetical protein